MKEILTLKILICKPDEPEKIYHVMFSRRQAAKHVLFSSPKDENTKTSISFISCFRAFVIIF